MVVAVRLQRATRTTARNVIKQDVFRDTTADLPIVEVGTSDDAVKDEHILG